MRKKDYTFHLLGLIVGVISLIVTIVSYKSHNNEKTEYRIVYSKSKVEEYRKIIDTLDRYDYVPHFRRALKYEKIADIDQKLWGFSGEPSKYLRDSVKYQEAKSSFFNQDREMLYWLLNFRNDSLRTGVIAVHGRLEDGSMGKMPLRIPLWTPYQSPLSSNIPKCVWYSSNHLQAISLIHGYLNGPDVYMGCIECGNDKTCLDRNYDFVESFLKHYHDVDTETLRERWQFWQDVIRLIPR